MQVSGERVHIPREYYKLNTFVILGVDVMFVAGVLFIVTYSRKMKFSAGKFLPRRTARQLANSLEKYYVCAHEGFYCPTLHDGQRI